MGFRHQRVKLEHSLMTGLRPVLEEISQSPAVERIIPGPIRRIRVPQPLSLVVKERTATGLRCQAKGGAVQEVFIVTQRPDEVEALLRARFGRP